MIKIICAAFAGVLHGLALHGLLPKPPTDPVLTVILLGWAAAVLMIVSTR